MTTKLDAVLAEEWTTDETGFYVQRPGTNRPNDLLAYFGEFTDDGGERSRAAVAVLGKRALALVLKHEWVYTDTDRVCAECHRRREDGHGPGCECGAVCDEARRIG